MAPAVKGNVPVQLIAFVVPIGGGFHRSCMTCPNEGSSAVPREQYVLMAQQAVTLLGMMSAYITS
jgi:hypothetical protein